MNAASLRAAGFLEQQHADLDSMMTPRIFPQDFENVGEIQQGMKSRGYDVGLGEARATP